MNIIDHYANEIARKLAADQDTLIRRNISRRVGDNWTDAEITPRLRWEIDPQKPEKLLLLDEQPLILIWPPQSENTHDGEYGVRMQMNWSIKYQEL